MIIPRPRHSQQYWLFISIFDNYPNIDRPLHLYANLIDMSYNNGLGKVIQKSKIILTDTLTEGGLNAVKHANGRDWWIVSVQARSDSTNCYHLHLLTPDSIIYQGIQCVGGKRIEDAGTVFSPDGNTFALANGLNTVDILDFDRCRGIFKHKERIYFPNNIGTYIPAISPNSRFLYINNVWISRLMQYDLLSSNIEASGIEIANLYPNDAVIDQILAPDNKIYIMGGTSPNACKLHVIDKPDLLGSACDFQFAKYTLPKFSNTNLPHFPHYRLGAEVGSDCDTLGTVSVIQPQEREKIKVYPNPAQDMLTIELSATSQAATFLLYDISGKVVARQEMIENKHSLFVGKLAKGAYFYEVVFKDKKEYGKLFIE